MLTSPEMRLRLTPCFIALSCLALLSACSKNGFDGRVYTSDDVSFRVGPVPASWHRVEVQGARLAFRDDEASATIEVGGRCGLDGDDVPLEALTRHLFLHFTARNVTSQEPVELDGRAALRTELSASLDGVPLRYLVFVLKKDGCVYDFVHVSPGARGRAEFERFVRGFGTVG
jgi:hypothetical protein